MSSRSAQTSTGSPVSVAGSQLIRYSFLWLFLCHSPHAHIVWARSLLLCERDCCQTFSAIFYSVYSAYSLSVAVRFLFALRCGAMLSSAAVSDQRILALLCVHISMNWPLTTPSCSGQKKDFKAASSWVTWHIHFLFWDSVFGASGGFGFLSDQSRGSRWFCWGSVVEQVLRWTDSRLNHSSLKSIQPFCVWHIISRDLQ